MHRTSRLTAGAALVAVGALTLAACGGSGTDDGTDGETTGTDSSTGELTVLIAPSGDAEADSVTAAVAAWSEESGVAATVAIASDLPQELSQGFASGDPADVFYLSPDAFEGYASNGSLLPYGADLGNIDDFYPSLVDQFTFQDELYCAPKDFSTLGLVINTDAWAAAGLTDADIPTTWDELATVSAALTTDTQTGLVFGGEYTRIGVFIAQAGGAMVDGDSAVVDSAENAEALTYVQEQLVAGSFAYASTVGAGWGGEAFGTGLAAMTIEGNWIAGAMNADFPDVNYTVVELPAGPGGQGTMVFTNCWGIAADSADPESAVSLVEYLTATEQQLAFGEAFGVMPSVQSAAEGWLAVYPDYVAFLNGAEYAQGVVTAQGAAAVITDFNAQLEGLATGDPQAILEGTQANLQAVLDENAS